ncbi:hypothetical protein ECEC4437_5920, partial [Escherichia coli EC4437]
MLLSKPDRWHVIASQSPVLFLPLLRMCPRIT